MFHRMRLFLVLAGVALAPVALAQEPPPPPPLPEPPPPSAPPAPPPGPAAAPEPTPAGARGDAGLSIGSGPRPFNTLTLGLTGLGARYYRRGGSSMFFVGGSLGAAKVATYDEDDRDDRYEVGITTVSASGGMRFERASGRLVPYTVLGGLFTYLATSSGAPEEDRIYTTSLMGGAGMGGLGIDGMLTPSLSLGAEVGGMLGGWIGTSKDDEGEVDGKSDGLLVTTYTAVQATVWR